jgi:hypothetical protein
MSMEKILRAAIEERKRFIPKGQGLGITICDRCHTLVLDGKCWCSIGILSDEDLNELEKEWKERSDG